MNEKYVIDEEEVKGIYENCRSRYNKVSRIISGYSKGIINVDWLTVDLLQKERSVLAQYMLILGSICRK